MPDLPLLFRCAFAAASLAAATACSAGDDPSAFEDEVADAAAAEDAGLDEEDAARGVDATSDAAAPDAGNGCPEGMARLDTFCVDRFEAHVVDVDDAGKERPHSPYETVEGRVRAKVAAGVVPQGYISQVQAAAACAEANKRLCTATEFASACRGSADGGAYYPYGGTTKKAGACNEGKGSFVPKLFGPDARAWTYDDFNDPRLNQIDGGLARTGAYASCVSPAGVHDCVGNLHEWGADPADAKGRGRFRGGFYGDAELNGPGCLYVTSAHELTYHDYSTGFRCCAEVLP